MRFQASKIVLLTVLGFVPAAAFGHPHKPVSRTARTHAAQATLPHRGRDTASHLASSQGGKSAIRTRKQRSATETGAVTQGRRRRHSLTLTSAVHAKIPRVTPVALGNPQRHEPPRPQIEAVNLSPPDPAILTARHEQLVMLPALKGSHEILVRQNVMADQDGLLRIQDDADLDRMRLSGQLVPIPAAPGIQIDTRLPANRHYCRPWTAQFLIALAAAHYAYFHSALQVNSAVRTVEFQHRLLRINGNAAPADGETASPHLTGQAVDLAKKGLSTKEIAWLRAYLTPLIQEGKLDVEEEFQQACFHISVYRRYAPSALPRSVVQDRNSAPTVVAGANMR